MNNDLISRSALLEDISESVVFSGRSGETSAEMRGAHKVTDRIKVAPSIEQPTWISVDERLPETIACSAGTAYSEAVIVFTTGNEAMIAIFDGEDFLSDGIDYWDAEHDEVTHWMPLPQPPKGE